MHLNLNRKELGDYIKSCDLLHDIPVHDLNSLNHVNSLLAAYSTVLDHNTLDNRCELARRLAASGTTVKYCSEVTYDR